MTKTLGSDEPLVGDEPSVREGELPLARRLVGLALTAEVYGGGEPYRLAPLSVRARRSERLRDDGDP